ncbi:MAG: hypothetical protein CMH47_09405 [Muricauda sp.]|nr:hypothetical protein [Allomuricauda sp.]
MSLSKKNTLYAMVDLTIFLVGLAAIFGGILVYWIRLQMESLGYKYPMFNASFRMISDFSIRKSSDKQLRNKYYQTLVIILVLWFGVSFGFWLLFD